MSQEFAAQPTESLGDDAALIQDMQKQFGDAPAETAKQPEPEKSAAPEVKKDEPKKDEAKPERNWEELERNYKNLQGALGESRAEARESKRIMEEMRTQVTNMQALMQRMREQSGDLPEPDPQRQFVDHVRGLTKEVETLRRESEEQREMRELTEFAVRAEQEFQAKSPDYMQAVNHLAQSRMTELAYLMPDTAQMQDYAAQAGYKSVPEMRQALM